MASAEKLHIQKILNHTGGNKAETARLLEIGIATLYRKIDEYQIK
jgi:DNA-binding NtrC family response regulator